MNVTDNSQSSISKKEEDKRRYVIVSNVLGLKGPVIQHPVVTTMVQKYMKKNIGEVEKDVFKLDLLRMFAVHRLNEK